MRDLVLMLAVVLAALVAGRSAASASEVLPAAEAVVSVQAQEVDDNDDTRVEVQLVVLAVALGTVFVFGTGAYFVRRKLGLVPPPPDQQADGDH
jgi:hypothetical protein